MEIIDCESSTMNVYDGACLNKIASLCCTNCNSMITIIYYRFFSEYVPKNYILGSTTEVSPRGFCKKALYKISEEFFARYLCHSLSIKVASLQSIGCNFTEKEVSNKNILN